MDFGHPAAIFVSSFIIGLSGAMMPGPLLAVTIRHASTRGFSAAPLLVLGHAILEAALVCLLLFGLMEWIRGDAAIIAIALLGSAMLLRMAAGMAREVRTLHFDAAACGSPGRAERRERIGRGASRDRRYRHLRLEPVLVALVGDDRTRVPVAFARAGMAGRPRLLLRAHPVRRGVVPLRRGGGSRRGGAGSPTGSTAASSAPAPRFSSSSPSPSGISGCRVLSASCSGRISSVEAST